jgi:hypothetical protein
MKAFYLILIAVLALPSCSPIRDREELSKETLNSAVSDKGLFFEQFLLAKDLLDQENGLRSRNSLSAAVTLLRKSKEIAPDRFWPLDFYLGYAYGLQGKSQLSLQYFLQAAKLSGTTLAWENAALIASQKGHHLLAYSIYDYLRKHKSERITDASAIYPWLDKAYGGSQKTKTSEPSLSDADQKFYCKVKEETSEDDNSDDEDSSTSSKSESDTASLNVATGVPSMNFSFVKPDPASEENKDKTEQVRKDPVVQKELIDPCDIKTVLIDAFVIKRRTIDNSKVGVDLVSLLQAQFGAVLVNYSLSDLDDGITSTLTTSKNRSVNLSIPDVTTALSLASDGMSLDSIQASLSISASLGKQSKLFDGTEVYIVSTGDGSGEFTKTIGLDLAITPEIISSEFSKIAIGVENGQFQTRQPSTGFQVLNTLKLTSQIVSVLEYGTPYILSNFTSNETSYGNQGQSFLRDIPVVKLFTNAETEVVIRKEIALMVVLNKGWSSPLSSNSRLIQARNELRRIGVPVPAQFTQGRVVLPYPVLNKPSMLPESISSN